MKHYNIYLSSSNVNDVQAELKHKLGKRIHCRVMKYTRKYTENFKRFFPIYIVPPFLIRPLRVITLSCAHFNFLVQKNVKSVGGVDAIKAEIYRYRTFTFLI